jgi:hypothetical protein
VHTEYRLHAARHPEAAAALREHSAGLHTRLAALIGDAAARAGVRLVVPPDQLAPMVLALHDGLVIARVPTGPGETADGTTELERTALLLLLRSVAAGATTPTND